MVKTRKRSSRKRKLPKGMTCQKMLGAKIGKNMKEMKKGKFVSPSQAVAVAYSQTGRKYKGCQSQFTKKRKSRKRSNRRSKTRKGGRKRTRSKRSKRSRKTRKRTGKSRRRKSRRRTRKRVRNTRKRMCPYHRNCPYRYKCPYN